MCIGEIRCNNLGENMNVQLFSRALKLAGISMIVCAYLFLYERSVLFALITTWFGISVISTSFFIDCKNADAEDEKAKAEIANKTKTAHSNRKVEA